MSTSKDLEVRCESLFQELVPSEGKASTLEGEMIRAVGQIVYRYRNDGDYFYSGYGCETAGPSQAFLISTHCPIAEELKKLFKEAAAKKDDKYEEALVLVIEAVVTYVETRAGEYTPNNVDSRNFKSNYIDRSHDLDNDSDDDDDEDW